jgi:hypothetical protein
MIRFANRPAESKDPADAGPIIGVELRSQEALERGKNSLRDPRESNRRGVLRRVSSFAKRMN